LSDYSVDVQLNSTMRLISGTLSSTPLPWLPVLSNIEPPALRRKAATDKLVEKIVKHFVKKYHLRGYTTGKNLYQKMPILAILGAISPHFKSDNGEICHEHAYVGLSLPCQILYKKSHKGIYTFGAITSRHSYANYTWLKVPWRIDYKVAILKWPGTVVPR